MTLRIHTLDYRLAALGKELDSLRGILSPAAAAPLERWRADAAALQFHLNDAVEAPRLVAILGGTGTGKSTLVNRLLGANVTATSFRRTFTSGAVAITGEAGKVPTDWLGVERHVADPAELPARGRPDLLIIVPATDGELSARLVLIDTPDLDGDQPQHHVQADRVFRWAQAVLFLVSPEKYQMTELLPYYRLAARYRLPAIFVMNKCEETAMLEDYRKLLAERQWPGAPLFAVPRDDAAYEPPPGADLAALRSRLLTLQPSSERDTGLCNRAADLLGRLTDQVIAPLRSDRAEADRLIAALRAMETPEPGIDVNPITRQLQRRLQERSVLYLMGPGRILQRVRQVPGLLARLPRTLWDAVAKGRAPSLEPPTDAATADGGVPDFGAALRDQFSVVLSRIDDTLRSNPTGQRWVAQNADPYAAARLDPAAAGRIAEEELAELRAWLEQRWNATPRDTLLILKLVRYLPGGAKLVKWTESAPYLLALIVATHHAFFGHVDLMILGGYTLATWLTEKLSNEVTARVRQANRRIAERFAEMAHAQITRTIEWLNQQSPEPEALTRLESHAEDIAEMLNHEGTKDTKEGSGFWVQGSGKDDAPAHLPNREP